jgi:universal stress protein A
VRGGGEGLMIRLEKILVPTDFSDASECALRYGRAMAAAFHAHLHVLHVMESLIAHAWAAEVYVSAMPNLRDEIEREARERLTKILDPAGELRPEPRVVLQTGNPFIEIIRYARDEEIDLIVMGTHGLGPIAHMLLGSVAEKVVRKAPCPVLTVRSQQHEFVMP